ncbi:alpha-1,2-fucosyltransferase [Butyrivibrio sp. DSM 10294]|uniref:alpha-1,2-fucosyltransferase n=1 Tax=Butyrivibrio sp. DSM 10294 TaxID=2972457 RepID=UPI00234E4090|nr:alpha-1,2-fucosyltransferase [Butyrivibrio sp. DSM 10294]MDC7292855.1 alpha-1,2-fucosyltransferase [Butyrivibrio sp. DSM 10294]
MIVVRFGGGLGNQLFQYALALILKEKYQDVSVKCDIASYELFDEHEGFEIPNIFEFDLEIADYTIIKRFCPAQMLAQKLGFKALICNRINRYTPIWNIDKLYRVIQDKRKRFRRITDNHIGRFNPEIMFLTESRTKDYYLEGAWQNLGYFTGYRDWLKNKMRISRTICDEEMLEVIKEQEAVGIHIRGGDFCNNKRLNICGISYYEKAIRQLETLRKDLTFYVFTDDKEKAQRVIENLELCNAYIISGNAYADFILLNACKYKIISNSTFSFWAAYLSDRQNESALTIAPMFIVKEKKNYIPNSVPDDWILVDNRNDK